MMDLPRDRQPVMDDRIHGDLVNEEERRREKEMIATMRKHLGFKT
jgi:hypothetical protein